MDDISFPTATLNDLPNGEWIRMADGEVGVIHDRVDCAIYRKACIEVPDARYPRRFLSLDTVVEHIQDRQPRRISCSH